MFWTVPLSIIRSFSLYTHQWYMPYRFVELASRIRTEPVLSWSCSQAVSKPVWHVPLLCVQRKTADDGQRNCPKHVEFYSKNKFEKLVHLVGFIIRIYPDAQSPERQNGEYNWSIFQLCVASVSSSQYFTASNSGSCLKDSCDWEKINQLSQERTPSRVATKPLLSTAVGVVCIERTSGFVVPQNVGWRGITGGWRNCLLTSLVIYFHKSFWGWLSEGG